MTLLKDIQVSGYVPINKSLILDGDWHIIKGNGQRGSAYPTIVINQGGQSDIDVVIRNLIVHND